MNQLINLDPRYITFAVVLGLTMVGALANGIWASSKRHNVRFIMFLSFLLTPIPVAVYLFFTRRRLTEQEYELERFASNLVIEAQIKEAAKEHGGLIDHAEAPEEKSAQPQSDSLPIVLSIAGSDASGGAGIQADLKTCAALRCYGMTAITAVTAQNTQEISAVYPLPAGHVAKQIDAVLEDIGAHAIKTGMLVNTAILNTVVHTLRQWNVKNLVVDTVLAAESGTELLTKEARAILTQELFPLATIITPNIPEAEILTGITIDGEASLRKAAEALHAFGPQYVLIKGGHLEGPEAIDWLYNGTAWRAYAAPRINTPNNHGTGCTLATAIAVFLAKGQSIEDAVQHAKDFITGALQQSLDLGKGSGPLDHGWQHRDTPDDKTP